MDTFKRDFGFYTMLIGFAGTFIGIGVGWADIKATSVKCAELAARVVENRSIAEKQAVDTRTECEKQIADIRANGTELSRRESKNQENLHAEMARRTALLEDAVREYANVRIEIAQTKGEIIEIKDRLNGILTMLNRVNIVPRP